MKFYNWDGNEFEFEFSNKIGEGNCGEVYQYSSEWVLKQYYDMCSEDYRLTKDIYDVIEEMNSPYIAEVKDLLFKNKIEHITNDAVFRKYEVDAYTCRYIKPNEIDILSTSTDYLVDNMNELSKLFSKFSKQGVCVDDLKVANTIIQEDKVILIDLDSYRKVDINKSILEDMNQKMLLNLFRGLLIHCIRKYEYSYNLSQTIYKIFDAIYCSGAPNVVEEAMKYFSKYKYPIDRIR